MFLNSVKIPSKLSYTFLDVHNKKKKKKGALKVLHLELILHFRLLLILYVGPFL